jgi:hypothetical protein
MQLLSGPLCWDGVSLQGAYYRALLDLEFNFVASRSLYIKGRCDVVDFTWQ